MSLSSQDPAPACFCGQKLSKCEAGYCYYRPDRYSGRVYCDRCMRIQDTGYVWHCPSGKIAQHPRGYDLCLSCGAEAVQYQRSMLRSPHQSAADKIKATQQSAKALYGSKSMTLYHVTDKTGADGIKASGYRMKCDTTGMFGGGIYFAESKEIAQYKSLHKGYLVTAQVRVGREKEVGSYTAGKFTLSSLLQEGYDSVKAPKGSGTGKPERVVYSGEQVRVVSIQRFDGERVYEYV